MINKIKVSKKDISELKKMKKFDVEYSDDIIKSINLLTYKSSQVSPFGSFIFSNLPYAGDIDLQEYVEHNEETPYIMKSIISKITQEPLYRKMYLLGDIKIGRLKYLEQLHNNIGYLSDGKIYGYNPEIFEMFNKKYMKLGFDIPELNDPELITKWVKLYGDLHNAETLRWTPDEIMTGYKTQDMNIYKIDDVLQNSDLNKIDMYYFSETKGKFIEITNILYSRQETRENIMYAIALNGLRYLLLKPQNLMKYLKRYYSYKRQEKDWAFLKVVSEYLQGNINMLSSCATDLSVLKTMSEFGYNLKENKRYIHSHINNIIGRLQNIFEASIPADIFIDIKKILDYDNWEDIIDIIKNVVEYMLDIINKHTLEFIEKNKIPVLMP